MGSADIDGPLQPAPNKSHVVVGRYQVFDKLPVFFPNDYYRRSFRELLRLLVLRVTHDIPREELQIDRKVM